MIDEQQIETAAFAIYRQFIRNGAGSLMARRENGRIVVDGMGKPAPETPDEAVERRWRWLTEPQKDSYRREALAALEAVR